MFEKNQNLFNVLFNAASEGIIVVNEEQNIIASNVAADLMFGYEKGELVEKPLNILIPTPHKAAHPKNVKSFTKTTDTRQMGHGRDLYGVKKNGDLIPVEAGLNPFVIDGKHYVMSLIIDISVRKETQRQIKELNNELEHKIKIRTRELEESVAKLQELNRDLEEEVK